MFAKIQMIYYRNYFNDDERYDLGEFFIWNAFKSVRRLENRASSGNEKIINVAFEPKKAINSSIVLE